MKLTLNSDWLKAFEYLEESRKALLTYAVVCYISDANMPELSKIDRMIFTGVKETIDRQIELSKKRRSAGRKGGIASTTTNFAQAKNNFAQANENFAQAKNDKNDDSTQVNDGFAQLNENFAQAKNNFAQAKNNFGQAKCDFAQANDGFAQANDSLPPITPISSNNISYINSSSKEKDNKEKEYKEKENNEKESLRFGNIVLDFVDPLLADSFIEYLRYRAKIKKSLKTSKGIKARYNKLYKLCRGDPGLAKKIVDQTLEHEWVDFYPFRAESPAKSPVRTEQTIYTNDDYWNVDP